MPFTKTNFAAIVAFAGLTAAGSAVDLDITYTFSMKNQACGGITMKDFTGAKDMSIWKFKSTRTPGSAPTDFACAGKVIKAPTNELDAAFWDVGYIFPATDGSDPKHLRVPAYTTDGRAFNGCVSSAEYVEPGASTWTGCVYLIH